MRSAGFEVTRAAGVRNGVTGGGADASSTASTGSIRLFGNSNCLGLLFLSSASSIWVFTLQGAVFKRVYRLL
jgi:hypothetical protein